jgi:hypothetical protein
MIYSSQRPSKPADYIDDCWICSMLNLDLADLGPDLEYL